MIRYVVAFLLSGAAASFAQNIDPLQPVARVVGVNVAQYFPAMPKQYKTTTNYDKATALWNKDGWVQAEVITDSFDVTNQIPAEIQQVAAEYKSSMDTLFGAGSVTNESITKEYVTVTLALNTNVTADVGVRLRAYYEILSGFWQGANGTLHDYPWDQSEFVRTHTVNRHEPFLRVVENSVTFDSTAPNTSVTNSIVLVNARSESITGTVAVAGAVFSVPSPTFDLAPNTTQPVELIFSPTVEGDFSGSVIVTSTAGTYSRPLTGYSWTE